MDLDVLIENLVIGDDYDFRREVTDIPEGATLTKAWLTIQIHPAAADSEAVIQKEITVDPSDDGQILDEGGSSGEGEIIFQLTKTETADLYPNISYPYDIQVLTSTDKVHTLEKGLINPIQGITKASS